MCNTNEKTCSQDEIKYAEIKWYKEECSPFVDKRGYQWHWMLIAEDEAAYLPDVEEIGPGQGWIPRHVKRVIIHPNTKRIGDNAFGCSAINYVDLGHVEYIGKGAFLQSQVKDVIIPQSVKFIASHAFYNVKTHVVVIYSKDVVFEDNHSIERHFKDTQHLYIYGYPGSTTEEYCKKYGYPFYDIADYEPGKHSDIEVYTMDMNDPEKHSYYAAHPVEDEEISP